MLKEIEFPKEVHATEISAVMFQSYSAQGLVSVFVQSVYFCIRLRCYPIFPVSVLEELHREKFIYMLSQVFQILTFSGLQRYTTKVIYLFGCWRQTFLLKILPKFWQTFQNRFVNIMLPFLTGSTLKRQYNKTTQLESTLVQNPYIFDITYVPTIKQVIV